MFAVNESNELIVSHIQFNGWVNTLEFVASYVNYYVCNAGVIAAQFGDSETDAIAVDTLNQHYPGRDIITLNVDALGEIGGGIHCATQQMPVPNS